MAYEQYTQELTKNGDFSAGLDEWTASYDDQEEAPSGLIYSYPDIHVENVIDYPEPQEILLYNFPLSDSSKLPMLGESCEIQCRINADLWSAVGGQYVFGVAFRIGGAPGFFDVSKTDELQSKEITVICNGVHSGLYRLEVVKNPMFGPVENPAVIDITDIKIYGKKCYSSASVVSYNSSSIVRLLNYKCRPLPYIWQKVRVPLRKKVLLRCWNETVEGSPLDLNCSYNSLTINLGTYPLGSDIDSIDDVSGVNYAFEKEYEFDTKDVFLTVTTPNGDGDFVVTFIKSIQILSVPSPDYGFGGSESESDADADSDADSDGGGIPEGGGGSSGTPVEVETNYESAYLGLLNYVQSADVMTLTHPLYPPSELRRTSETTFELVPIDFDPPVDPPSDVVGEPTYVQPAPFPGEDPIDPETDPQRTIDRYVVTSVHTDLVRQSAATVPVEISNNLLSTGSYNTITWVAPIDPDYVEPDPPPDPPEDPPQDPNISRFYVYKEQGGIYGYIGSTTGTMLVDDNIAPDMSKTPPIPNNDFVSEGNYPRCATYFEQRRVFAGSNNDPHKIWMTRSGTESDMSFSFPIRSDDRIEFRVAAREANTIRHMVPLTQLLLLTASSEWVVKSIDSDAITPTSISVVPQAYIGAADVAPVMIGNMIVYISARGGHVRELGFSLENGGFVSKDLSLRASHLFSTGTIVDATATRTPFPIVWFVSSDGMLIGMTYIPEHEVYAWHRHETDGAFESICAVSEGDEDYLYASIRRVVNGQTVRYIERMHTRRFSSIEDCFFVDSGLSYDGTNTSEVTVTISSSGSNYDQNEVIYVTASSGIFAYPQQSDVGDCIVLTDGDGKKYRVEISSTTSSTVAVGVTDNQIPQSLRLTPKTNWAFARDTMSGLGHLEAKTVSILADGCVQSNKVVNGGYIKLDRAATKVTVGLPFTSQLTTLPINVDVRDVGNMSVYNVRAVTLRVNNTSGIKVGKDSETLTEYKQRKTESLGTYSNLINEDVRIVVSPSWGTSPQVTVVQNDPLPITVAGMAIEVAVGV